MMFAEKADVESRPGREAASAAVARRGLGAFQDEQWDKLKGVGNGKKDSMIVTVESREGEEGDGEVVEEKRGGV